MPIQEVNGGYRWGKSGKVYPTKAQAAKQARAAYASGYKGYVDGGIIPEGWADKPPSGRTHIGGTRQTNKDPFVRDFIKQMGLMSLMSNPNTRPGFIKGMSALNFFKNPSRKTGIGALAPMLGFNRSTRDLVKFLPFLADPSARTAKGIAQKWAQNQGLGALFKKYGPKAAYSLFNQGGNFGLGQGGRFGQGIGPSLAKNPLQTIGKLKWAAANPAFAGIMALLNRVSPPIKGQTGPLGRSLGPQLRNLFGFGGGRDREEGTGIFGGTLGPKLRDLFTRNRDESPIQEIDVTAQRRQSPEEKAADFNRSIALHEEMLGDRIGETGGESQDFLSGLVPRAAQGTNQMLRAANWARSGPHRKLMAKIASGQMPVRKISSGGGGRK
jgi:hypothetical protein